MPTYEYMCEHCTHVTEHVCSMNERHQPPPCQQCSGTTSRIMSAFRPATIMHEHYNPTVGKPISSMNQLKSELSRASDEQSEKTGVTHNYQPVDLRELKQQQSDITDTTTT